MQELIPMIIPEVKDQAETKAKPAQARPQTHQPDPMPPVADTEEGTIEKVPEEAAP